MVNTEEIYNFILYQLEKTLLYEIAFFSEDARNIVYIILVASFSYLKRSQLFIN